MSNSERKITKIERQENNRQRLSIYLDGEFAFGLNDEIVLKHNINVNQTLQEDQIEDLLSEDEKKRAKQKAFSYLARRDHSEKELSDKLRRKGFREPIIIGLIEDLKQSQLINDGTFSRQFARNKIIQKSIGRRELAFSLKQKGISKDILEATLEEVYSEYDEKELALRLANQKLKTIKNIEPIKVKKRISDFLFRRGFNWEIVEQVFEEISWDKL
ncbi:RecX family transcriptional regulator [candidate division KSB1 bacterium]|nr:RecX family transcriptional regulator [candidate division KSB1 bacterium]